MIKQNQTLHLVGTLTEDYERFDNLQVIRQSFDSLMADQEYMNGKKPLKPSANLFEALDYVDFSKEFIDANLRIPRTAPEYCTTFPKMYQNANVVAFDTNYGDSFGQEVDILAAKTWAPYNAIKIYEYDYVLL